MARRRQQTKPTREDSKDSREKQQSPDSSGKKTISRKVGHDHESGAEKLASSCHADAKNVSSSFVRWFGDLPEYQVARSDEESVLSSLNFKLNQKLGEGGMGVVFSGLQKSIGREIALKFLKKEFLADKDAARRFILEGQITGRLDHPNILPIFDLGRSQSGDLFIAMQKISGSRWDQTYAQNRPRENLEIMLRVCDAIAYAHSRGVIHRDLKPENVMLGEYGEIIITDWGLAMSVDQEKDNKDSQAAQMQAGTPAYMSPELARCDLSQISERTDVYLLGATLYEIWTGKAPHTGEDVWKCLEAAAANRIQPVAENDEIVEIARKAMATYPSDRYASVRHFQQEIQDYLLHSESLSLIRSANEELEKAGVGYTGFSRALALYEEALKLWPESVKAKEGLSRTRLHFAQAALERRDLNLGESLLEPACPEHCELLTKIQYARRIRLQRIRRLQILSVGFAVFAVAVFFIILNIKSRLETERDIAVASFNALNLEKDSLLAERDTAINLFNQLTQEKQQLLRPFFDSLQPR